MTGQGRQESIIFGSGRGLRNLSSSEEQRQRASFFLGFNFLFVFFDPLRQVKLCEKTVTYEGRVRSWKESPDAIASRCECLVLSDPYFRGGFHGGTLSVDIAQS